jgi:Phosphoribosylanthranilate isomerase
MITQIYEIGNPKEAREVVEAGVDNVGVLVGDGEFPNELSIEKAKEVFAAVPSSTKKVALSLSGDLNKIGKILKELQPEIIHLGTLPVKLSPGDVSKLKKIFPKIKFMRSIPVLGEEIVDLAKQYEGIADYLLLDSYKKDDNQVGATGLIHDWSISKKIIETVKIPVILAGGLGLDNVAEAIRQVHPYGVDSKTKTDKAGSNEKDINKVREFVRIAKTTK